MALKLFACYRKSEGAYDGALLIVAEDASRAVAIFSETDGSFGDVPKVIKQLPLDVPGVVYNDWCR